MSRIVDDDYVPRNLAFPHPPPARSAQHGPALAHVVAALRKLRAMAADMEDLKERAVAPELQELASQTKKTM